MQTIPQEQRQDFIAKVRTDTLSWHRQHLSHVPISGLCILWADRVIKELAFYGVRGIFQAGSASWPFRTDWEADPEMSHLSYVWDQDEPRTVYLLKRDLLPEMHCWVGIPASQELVDLTTIYLPELVNGWPGFRWQAPIMDHLWTKANDLPHGVSYTPDLAAINVVLKYRNEYLS